MWVNYVALGLGIYESRAEKKTRAKKGRPKKSALKLNKGDLKKKKQGLPKGRKKKSHFLQNSVKKMAKFRSSQKKTEKVALGKSKGGPK